MDRSQGFSPASWLRLGSRDHSRHVDAYRTNPVMWHINCLLSKSRLLQPMRKLVKPAGCRETMEVGSDTVNGCLCVVLIAWPQCLFGSAAGGGALLLVSGVCVIFDKWIRLSLLKMMHLKTKHFTWSLKCKEPVHREPEWKVLNYQYLPIMRESFKQQNKTK